MNFLNKNHVRLKLFLNTVLWLFKRIKILNKISIKITYKKIFFKKKLSRLFGGIFNSFDIINISKFLNWNSYLPNYYIRNSFSN